MLLGERLRALREVKNLSQGDIQQRTGLLRNYISRVENNHTVPAVETLEKIARAMEIPLYQLFYEGEEPPQVPGLPKQGPRDKTPSSNGVNGGRHRGIDRLRALLSRMDEKNRELLISMAQRMALRKRNRGKAT